jgi:hypothetical protein
MLKLLIFFAALGAFAGVVLSISVFKSEPIAIPEISYLIEKQVGPAHGLPSEPNARLGCFDGADGVRDQPCRIARSFAGHSDQCSVMTRLFKPKNTQCGDVFLTQNTPQEVVEDVLAVVFDPCADRYQTVRGDMPEMMRQHLRCSFGTVRYKISVFVLQDGVGLYEVDAQRAYQLAAKLYPEN